MKKLLLSLALLSMLSLTFAGCMGGGDEETEEPMTEEITEDVVEPEEPAEPEVTADDSTVDETVEEEPTE